MVAIGLVLLVLAALLVTAIITGPAHPFDVELFGVEIATSNVGLFFSGAAVGGGVLIALLLVRAGLQPRRRRRGEKDASEAADAEPAVPRETPRPGRVSAARTSDHSHAGDSIDRDTAA